MVIREQAGIMQYLLCKCRQKGQKEMASVMFTVPGKPQGKARARTYYNASTKKHCSTTPENTVLYENFIKDRYLQMAKGAFLERERPVTLRIIARYLPPKSVSKKRKLDMLEGRELPLKKPDMDNIVKVVADALNGVAYHDDTQIALVQAKKCYSAVEGLDVTVEEYAAEFLVTIEGADKATTLYYSQTGVWFDEQGEPYKVVAWMPLPEVFRG